MSKLNKTHAAKPQPIWLRAIREPAAAAFLKANKAEFPVNSLVPDPIEFNSKVWVTRLEFVQLMQSQMPFADARRQRLAELYLTMPAKEIRKVWPGHPSRRQVYLMLRKLKEYVLEQNRREKADLLLGGDSAELDTLPGLCAIKQITFTLNERTATAFLIARDDEEFWVDQAGKRHLPAVQEILNDLDEYKAGFGVLDVAIG